MVGLHHPVIKGFDEKIQIVCDAYNSPSFYEVIDTVNKDAHVPKVNKNRSRENRTWVHIVYYFQNPVYEFLKMTTIR